MVSLQKELPVWAKELETPSSGEKAPVFKLASGAKEITFLNDGRKWHDEVYDRDYIIYNIAVENKKQIWFVSNKAFGLLRSITELGFPLNGKKAIVSRTGAGRKDTRWSLTVPNEQ